MGAMSHLRAHCERYGGSRGSDHVHEGVVREGSHTRGRGQAHEGGVTHMREGSHT